MIGYLTYLDFSNFSTLRYLNQASIKYNECSILTKFDFVAKYFE